MVEDDDLAESETFIPCDGCNEDVVVVYRSDGSILLRCGCPATAIDISERITDRSVFDPIAGKWSVLDIDLE